VEQQQLEFVNFGKMQIQSTQFIVFAGSLWQRNKKGLGKPNAGSNILLEHMLIFID
jgi:hypothetical protein